MTEIPILSVSEISLSLKSCVEQVFSHIKVRGEVSDVKRATSGHTYFSLKDKDAVLSAICWRGRSSTTTQAIQEGLEVVCTGKLSTYPGRSNYQMIVETAEPAGVGALLKLLNERREKLAKEGLFDESHKQPIPFLPTTIGVITSPTGAVIRDIIHRLTDRFPRHVLVWPVAVQGTECAEQVAAAVKGFNNLPADFPRPDILIVARGGGSLEDLWGFNEECVVRAVYESKIPVISAVGHETSGILVIARTTQSAGTLSKLFKTKEVHKTYWALVEGLPKPTQGKIEAPLAQKRTGKNSDKRMVDENGLPAVSLYQVQDHLSDRVSWLQMSPLTGRTHQLRIHAAEVLKTPILGDERYGKRTEFDLPKKMFLHARAIALPLANKKVLTVEAPLPKHFTEAFQQFGFSEKNVKPSFLRSQK